MKNKLEKASTRIRSQSNQINGSEKELQDCANQLQCCRLKRDNNQLLDTNGQISMAQQWFSYNLILLLQSDFQFGFAPRTPIRFELPSCKFEHFITLNDDEV